MKSFQQRVGDTFDGRVFGIAPLENGFSKIVEGQKSSGLFLQDGFSKIATPFYVSEGMNSDDT